MSNRKLVLLAGGILLAAGLIGLVIVTAVYIVTLMVDNRHAVVIDAGSTSSKLNLYEWRDDPFRSNGDVKQINDSRVEPGISNYLSSPFKAYEELEQPLRRLLLDIRMDKWSQIPVYLAATAGMRLTLLEDPLGSMNLFDALRRGLQNSGLQVETPNERIRMLSGTEEGLFGWVSVNSILKLINAKNQVSPLNTVGSLDLGGASTQIAFVPAATPSNLATSLDYHSLRLFGHQYTVYSHSFLCYGKNELEKRTMGSVITSQSNLQSPIENPCYPKGYISPSKQTDSLFSGPCMSGTYATQVFKKDLSKPQSLGTTYTFNGTGNPDLCVDHIKKQFDTTTCSSPPCSFNDVHQPPTRGSFRAYAGFSYVLNYLFPKKNTGFTKSEVLNAVKKFCTTAWSEISKDTTENQQSFLAGYCFDGLYVYTLLDNYGFKTEESWKDVTFGAKVEGVSVSWALGYMLDQSGFLPSESPKLNFPMAAYIPLAILFCLMVLSGVCLLAISLCSKKNNSK